jgi:hypothetical protein
MSVICQATTQRGLLLHNLLKYYRENSAHLLTFLNIVRGESKVSLRLIDWCVTNFSKRSFAVVNIPTEASHAGVYAVSAGAAYTRINIFTQYKLALKAHSKLSFDCFCRHKRLRLEFIRPDGNKCTVVSTLGQLNFFRWAISNHIIDYIEKNFDAIEQDMNQRNTMSKKRRRKGDEEAAPQGEGGAASEAQAQAQAEAQAQGGSVAANHTRKKREELSESACRSVKKENVSIVVRFK